MELIEQHFLPNLLDFCSVVFDVFKVRDCAQPFYCVQQLFDSSVPFLCISLRGIAALVTFVIQFAAVRRQFVRHILYIFKEFDCKRRFAGSQSVYILLMAHHIFKMSFAGTAAAVAVAVYQKRLVANVFFAVSVLRLFDCQRRIACVVIAKRLHMRKQLSAVDTHPIKGAVGEAVEIV